MPSKRTISRACEVCGREFIARLDLIERRRGGRFCSHPCRHEWLRRLGESAFIEKFWAKVPSGDGCWEFQGILDKRTRYGYYGNGRLTGTRVAHRISWILTNGPIPDGLFVCHHCDNPPCVRPDHLFLGTCQDNMDDMVRKGRKAVGDHHYSHTKPEALARGESINTAKLTEADVRAIRARYAEGDIFQRELAAQYGVSRKTIQHAISGRFWSHV